MGRGMTIAELADSVGVTRQAISQYELGHTSPGDAVSRKIAEALNLPYNFFREPDDELKRPIGTTFFRSLLSATKKSRDTLSVQAKWVRKIYFLLNQYLEFPKDNIPVLGDRWVSYSYDSNAIENIAEDVRKHWGLGMGPISNVTLLLEKNGAVVARTLFQDEKNDAYSHWVERRPFIFLSSNKGSAARSRFDISHELGHFVLHMHVDNNQLIKNLKQVEEEANLFASAFLLPRDSFGQEVMSSSIEHFITLKKRWNVSIQAMIMRCQTIGILSENQILYLWKQISRRRMKKNEPFDNEMPPEKPSLLRLGMEALIKEGIMTPTEIVDYLKLYPKEIEELCSLPSGMLSNNDSKVVELKLKRKP